MQFFFSSALDSFFFDNEKNNLKNILRTFFWVATTKAEPVQITS